jgi:cysteine desulfurase
MNVYFDNSATTQPAPEVIKSMMEVLEKYYGNPSSLHHLGAEAEQLITRSKKLISTLLKVDPSEIFFTSGGTESNNLAVKGVAFAYQNRGKHLITTQIEHASVFDACKVLEENFGFEVTYLPVNKEGIVSVETLKSAIRSDTTLVSIMQVNNETGAIQPIEQIGLILKQYPKLIFHVDQVQGFGKTPLDVRKNQIDLLTISGHKLHAPKGTAMLFKRQGVTLAPLFHGGSQQNALRPGTENVAGIVSLAKAMRLAKENENQHTKHIKKLRLALIKGLQSLENVSINSPLSPETGAVHIVNVTFKGMKPEVLVHALEEKGIIVSTRSACSSKAEKPSRVLKALGLADEDAKSSIRISFSVQNTLEEVNYFLATLKELLPHYQKIMKV